MIPLEMKVLHSLVKLLPGQDPQPEMNLTNWSALRGEKTAVQLAMRWFWRQDAPEHRASAELTLSSALAERLTVSRVVSVPVNLAAYPVHDEYYLTTRPGLLPDLLEQAEPLAAGSDSKKWNLRLLDDQWQVFWLEFDIPADWAAGEYPLQIELKAEAGAISAAGAVTLTVVDAVLPQQTLIRTEWFYTDCLADYYRVPVFSEEHWQIVGRFIKTAVDHGVNMLLTPIFTPPLDTAVGGERTTTQLVTVEKKGSAWTFGFDRLKRWIDLAQSLGVRYFEMSHLFTQWGAKAAPKIMAEVDGRNERIFGWDTPATSPAYREFLAAFLPELTGHLLDWGLAGRCFFHISDEPGKNDLENYQQAKAQVKPYIKDFTLIDALSDYEFYTSGAVDKPIPANNHIQPFLDGQVPDLWTYYCCGQSTQVSNQFMAMPSERNRIIGVQFYLYQIEGFLHWGYNFYNSQHSLTRINPYLVNDAEASFPAGDAFLVYPGADGKPEPSIRIKVFQEALNDQRALQLLESLTSRQKTVDLIMEGLDEPITFSRYPRDAGWLLDLRRRVNQAIAACVG